MSKDTRPLVLLGAGGHAQVLVALVRATGGEFLGVCDPLLTASDVSRWNEIKVLNNDSALERIGPDMAGLVLGIGQIVTGNLRERIYLTWSERGYEFPALIHPTAWIAPGVEYKDGTQIMAGCVIQPGCQIGVNSILNTRASLDHGCRIGNNVHVAPGATLCGSVTVDDGAFIGAGATVIQGVHIGAGAVVGAGVTLVRSVASNEKITSVVSAPK